MTAVIAGAAVMLMRKGTRRHRRTGWIYLIALGVIFVTMVVMVVIRWPLNLHLLALGSVSLAAASLGVLNRRRHWSDSWHVIAMGSSYIGCDIRDTAPKGPIVTRPGGSAGGGCRGSARGYG